MPTTISSGDDIAGIINAGAINQEFDIGAGTYRITTKIQPKNGMKLIGASAATVTINAAKLLTGWSGAGPYTWSGSALAGPTLVTPAPPSYLYPQSKWAEQLYKDGVPLVCAGAKVSGTTFGSSTPATGEYYVDFDADTLKVFDNPSGHVMEFSGAVNVIDSTGTSVEVSGLKAFGSNSRGIRAQGANWNIHDCTATGSLINISIPGQPSTVVGNLITYGGQYGLNGDGDGQTVTDNEIHHNGSLRLYDSVGGTFAFGGFKFASTNGMDFLRNLVHHNEGAGCWWDVNCENITISNNEVHDNHSNGIWYEISYTGTISDNLVYANGWAGIYVSTSEGCTVSGNTVYGNGTAGGGNAYEIRLVDANRAQTVSAGHVFPHRGVDNTFTGNEVTLISHLSPAGGQRNSGGSGTWPTDVWTRNSWDSNTWHIPDLATNLWTWNNAGQNQVGWLAAGMDPAPPAVYIVDVGGLDFDDGKAHLACSLHYFNGIDTLAHAQTLATTRNAMVGWARIAGDSFVTNNYGTFADDMVTAASGASNPLVLLGYMKSMVRAPNDPGPMPEAFYAHTCAGARITSGSASLPTMQSGTIASPAFHDARGGGFNATKWAAWKAQDCGFAVSNFNATYTSALDGVELDTLGAASFSGGPCNNGTPYTKPDWIENVVRVGLVDVARAANPTLTVYGNGLTGASSFYAANNATSISSDGLLDHVDVGIAESWIRGNFDKWGVWPADDPTQANRSCWQNCVQMLIDGDFLHDAGIWAVVNIGNSVPAGGTPSGWVPYTTAQVDQWKRFSYCSFMLGQRGRSLYEFVTANTTKPWNETHAYWTQSIGVPDNQSLQVSDMRLVSGAYLRTYATGNIYVNPTATPINLVADQNYTNPDTGTSIGTGAQIHLNAHDGLLLLHDASSPTDTDSPLITITSPTVGQVYESGQVVTLDATVTDNDSVALVTAELDGGAALPCTALGSNVYEHGFGAVAPGSHSITVTATDAFPVTPLSSQKAVIFTVSEPPPVNTPPSVTVTGPADVVVLPATAIAECTAFDDDGVSGVHVSLDFGTPTAMTPPSAAAPGGMFTLDLGVLAEGNHRIDITATDANSAPLSRTVSRSFLVTTHGGDGDGTGTGGIVGGDPLVISTDIGAIELRIKERGLG